MLRSDGVMVYSITLPGSLTQAEAMLDLDGGVHDYAQARLQLRPLLLQACEDAGLLGGISELYCCVLRRPCFACQCCPAGLADSIVQLRQCQSTCKVTRPSAVQVLLDGSSVGFVDRVGSQQIQLQHPSAAAALQQHGSSAAQHQRALQMQQAPSKEQPAQAAALAGSQLVVIVHGMGRNSAATGFDLKGLVHQNVTLAGDVPAATDAGTLTCRCTASQLIYAAC